MSYSPPGFVVRDFYISGVSGTVYPNHAEDRCNKRSVGGELPHMHTRNARSRTEIDLLPPFGKPEVVTTGNAAADAALAGIAVAGTVALLSQS